MVIEFLLVVYFVEVFLVVDCEVCEVGCVECGCFGDLWVYCVDVE